ncbi:serine hydrolase domain-containing protein [Streptomyces sp. NPDC007983]|uniref:serine hydrolase domain-containing protein n=1 Tax=Streptomyces sp. NPDC007983 TaxID=3364800 RepID=UPI0036EAB65C
MLHRPTRTSGDERRPTARHDLQDRLHALARAHQVPGAQLAVHSGGTARAVHTGVLDSITGEPFTADTAVPIGSLTKCYTATVVMLLVADGDVELDDQLGDHVPELRRAGPPCTVRQVLSHTAGLASGPDSDHVAALTTARYLQTHCTDGTLVMAPGTDFSYSNAGYVAAGRLIETVTGMSWQEAVRSILLEPLGTMPSFIGAPGTPGRQAARGHSANKASGRTRPVHQNLAPAEAAAGALRASARDLVALALAHTHDGPGGLLPPELAQEMRRPVPGADPGVLADGWGLGFALFQRDAATWFGHDGNAQGTSCYLRADPHTGTVVAFTSNSNSGADLWHELTGELEEITGIPVPGAPARPRPATPMTPPASPTAATAQCTGIYLNGDVEYQVTMSDSGTLALSVDGDVPAPLVCHEDLTCDLVDPSSGRRIPGGRFVRDPRTGAVDRIQLSGRMARKSALV